MGIGFTALANGFSCWDHSRTAISLRAPADGLFFSVAEDNTIPASHHNVHKRDVFHKINNEDGTVSLLSSNGRFVSASEDGRVTASQRDMKEWERFSVVQ